MDLATGTATAAIILGVGVAVAGYLSRRSGGRFLVWFGAALILGPWSPFLEGRVSDTVQILISIGALALVVAGAIVYFIDKRQRLTRG